MPSIFITGRAAKCRIDSFSRAGQFVLMQRLADSPGSRTMSPPHTGHCFGIWNGLRCEPCVFDPHDFRDHVAAAFDHDGVADLQAEAFDFVFVVQRGARQP